MDPQETRIYIAILIASIIVATIIVYFAFSLIQQQKRTLELNRQNVLSEIATLEKERTRMAADLHDELGPLLSQVKFRVNSLELHDPEDIEQRDLSSQQIDEVIERVRGIARNLMPSSLIRKGLHAALLESATNISEHTTMKVTLDMQPGIEVDEEKSINTYRAIQEITQNAIKHAEASQLLIRISRQENKLVVICEDNGKGFDFEEVISENRGLGLRNLRSRIEIMGGQFNIMSKPGKGSQYLFQIPLT